MQAFPKAAEGFEPSTFCRASKAVGRDGALPANSRISLDRGPRAVPGIHTDYWRCGYANTYPDAIALVADGRVNVAALITGHYELEDTEGALLAGHNDSASIKVMVHPRRH
jgi:hypothetical protein